MGGRTVFIRFGVLGDSLVGASGQLIGQILRRQQGRWWLDSQQVVCLCTPACTGAYSVQFAQYVHQVHKCVHQVHSVYTRCTSVYSVHRVYSGCKWLATSGLLPHPHTHAAKWMLASGRWLGSRHPAGILYQTRGFPAPFPPSRSGYPPVFCNGLHWRALVELRPPHLAKLRKQHYKKKNKIKKKNKKKIRFSDFLIILYNFWIFGVFDCFFGLFV